MAVETPPTSGTQDVLDAMVASVMGRKAAAKTKLTPVGLERNGPVIAGVAAEHNALVAMLPNNQVAAFPNDHPQEAILAAVIEIERQMVFMAGALAAVRYQLGFDAVDAPTADPITEQKAKERAADAKAVERTAVLQASESVESTDTDEQVARVLANIDQKAAKAQAVTFRATDEPVTAPGSPVALTGALTAMLDAPVPNLALAEGVEITSVEGVVIEDNVVVTPDKSEAISPSGGAWVCPVHGTSIVMTSRKGRKYLACPQGDDFEKLA